LGAFGFFRDANATAVVLQQVAEAYALLFGNERRKIEFDLVGIGIFCETEPLRQSHDVGVDTDGRLTKGVAKHDIGCFSAHAREGQQIVEILRDISAETLNDFLAAVVNGSGLVAIEVDLAEVFF
jgi:hypothetical protein